MTAENLEDAQALEGDDEDTQDPDGSDTGNDEVKQDAKEDPAEDAEEADKGTPDPEEPEPPKKLSLADLDLDEILADERVKSELDKRAQSAKDRELAKERKRQADERTRREREDAERRRAEERRRFEEERDFEGLYSYDREQEAKANELLNQARLFTDTLIEQARQDYDPILGEDVVERIIQDVRSQQGTTPVTLASRLAEERRRTDVANATAEARKGLPDLVAQEVEAKLVELGLKKRAEKVEKGQVPSKDVTGDSKGKASKEDITYEKASEMFGLGDMSWSDFKPFKDEHERQRRL